MLNTFNFEFTDSLQLSLEANLTEENKMQESLGSPFFSFFSFSYVYILSKIPKLKENNLFP